jgi:hypothetical protein
MKAHRILASTALVVAGVAAAACGSDKSTGSKNTTTLSLTERAKLSQNFLTLASKVSDPTVAAALGFAGAVVLTGGNVTQVTVSTALASGTLGSAQPLSRPLLAEATPTGYYAIAVQIHNLQPANIFGDTGIVSAILLFKDSTDYILTFGAGEGTGTIPDNAAALFWTPPGAYWDGTAGTGTLNRGSVGGACQNFTPPAIQGATITCQTAGFTGAVNITSAEPDADFNNNTAAGSRTASLSSGALAGYVVTITPTGQ